jgi:hypothetical protein
LINFTITAFSAKVALNKS